VAPPLLDASFQLPRLQLAPAVTSSAGKEAIGFAARAGLILDPWQCYCLDLSLGERDDGKWASFEVCLICGRQNGKNAILEARVLAGLFLFGEELIIFTAHQFKTARRSFRRILRLIESTPALDRRVAKVSRSHGEEGIELKSGQELQFLARSGQSARGFSGDLLIWDEAMFLVSEDVGASLPLLSARTLATAGGPQVWYTASAGMMHSTQLARVRRRGIAGTDTDLTFMEYSIDPHTPRCQPSCRKHDTPFTEASYLKANPALQTGRLTFEHIERERAAMDAESFNRERLGIGTYPAPEDGWVVIPKSWWAAVHTDSRPRLDTPVCGLHTTPDRSMSAIAVCGAIGDGRVQIEIDDHAPGTDWLVPRAAQLAERWEAKFVVDPRSPAGSEIDALKDAGVDVVKPTVQDTAHACGLFYDAVRDDTLRYWAGQRGSRGHNSVSSGLAGAATRKTGTAWVWDDYSAAVDMSPLAAATWAHWGHRRFAGDLADYNLADSVGYDLSEIERMFRKGVYSQQDVPRLFAMNLLDEAGIAVLASKGVLR
jgi:hypothetical protein